MHKGIISSVFSGKEKNVTTPAASNDVVMRKIENPLVDRSRTYEWTSRVKHEDKKSGSYERYTTKEKASKGDLHVEKGTGQVGVKDEFKKSSTTRVGDKTGYTEYHTEHWVRDVNYGKITSTNTKYDSDSDYGHGYDDSDDDDDYDDSDDDDCYY
ncbi:hypothetical protein LOK49_LG05G02126 [Camellia lanceoleosa]|uniref:Uncharacterized protein n=1 Tax=Camellia lanceoleosa TaxID=1840588 RepID=A0ACC0HTI7_9ERIC|nr:hypothetical protein LOK49_LG05G02126 [Camellia lanceoleosa]